MRTHQNQSCVRILERKQAIKWILENLHQISYQSAAALLNLRTLLQQAFPPVILYASAMKDIWNVSADDTDIITQVLQVKVTYIITIKIHAAAGHIIKPRYQIYEGTLA